MAISDILKSLDLELESKLKELQEQFNLKKDNLKQSFENEKIDLINKQKLNLENKEKELITSKEIEAKMQAKKIFLSKKRKILDDVLEKTLVHLYNMKDDEFIKFIEQLLNKLNVSIDKIYINSKRKNVIEKIITNQSLKCTYEIDDNIKDGVIIISDDAKINFTFETIIYKLMKDKLEIELSNKFFI